MEQYYTPALQDIHIGYECETRTDPYPDWMSSKIEDADDLGYVINKEWEIRTLYLTKEQIEGEGWKIKATFLIADYAPTGRDTYQYMFIKGDFQLIYGNPDDQTSLIVRKGEWYPDNTVFKGTCPSINEFRTICKLLNIN